MSNTPSYHGYRFPPEIISHAVWLYHRFCLSIPAANYWSVVLYDADTRALLDNGEPFPSIASNINLKPNGDGSLFTHASLL